MLLPHRSQALSCLGLSAACSPRSPDCIPLCRWRSSWRHQMSQSGDLQTPQLRKKHGGWRLKADKRQRSAPLGELTCAGGLVPPAVAGRSVFEVVLTVVGPQAAVVEAEDVVDPVGLSGNMGGFVVWRGAPVVRSVRSAAPDGVSGQDLSTVAVIATLLPRSVQRTSRDCRNILYYLIINDDY